jgi:DeoR family suf operon transcriptional repressor
MATTRTKILEILAVQRLATAAELSRALQVTEADARHHLGLLVKDKLVEQAGTNPTGGRGRPRTVYRLTLTAQPDNIAGLASALLLARRGAEQTNMLRHAASQLGAALPAAPNAGPRLYAAVQRLNELHYQAHWEAHAEAPIIQLGNCPYAPLIQEHPELCQMDKFLLEELSGMTVQQTAKLEASPQGALRCIFHLIHTPINRQINPAED